MRRSRYCSENTLIPISPRRHVRPVAVFCRIANLRSIRAALCLGRLKTPKKRVHRTPRSCRCAPSGSPDRSPSPPPSDGLQQIPEKPSEAVEPDDGRRFARARAVPAARSADGADAARPSPRHPDGASFGRQRATGAGDVPPHSPAKRRWRRCHEASRSALSTGTRPSGRPPPSAGHAGTRESISECHCGPSARTFPRYGERVVWRPDQVSRWPVCRWRWPSGRRNGFFRARKAIRFPDFRAGVAVRCQEKLAWDDPARLRLRLSIDAPRGFG